MEAQVDSETLVLRETLLGALKSRLDSESPGELRIHSSDFHTAVENLGMRFGTRDVDSIMVMCRISENGFIDFSPFAKHIKDEREKLKYADVPTKVKGNLAMRASSSATPIQPLRPSDAHQLLSEAEKQTAVVTLKKNEVRKLFEEFDNGSKSTQQFKTGLEQLGIKITSDCDNLLRRSEATDTSFSQLLRSLCIADRSGPPLSEVMLAKPGGFTQKKSGEFGSRKRTNPIKHQSVLSASGQATERKQIGERGTGSRKGKFFSDSSGITGVMDYGAGSTLTTTAKAHMQQGQGQAMEHGFNSEKKMLRQQIFSLVRKMDDGEITARDFQDKLFTMGFEIPPEVLQLLKNFDSSGRADFKQFVRAFERYLESRNQESDVTPEQLEVCKQRFKDAISARGASGIASLARVFKIMDDDGSKALSLSEFKKGLADYKSDIPENDVRILFNSFDKNGDGQLSYDEFLVAIRGDLNSTRANLVRAAFQKLDKTGNGIVDVEDLQGVYDPSNHPDVIDGKITPEEALLQVLDAFEQGEADGQVTFAEFTEYYKNISASIDRDDYFAQMIKTAWQLDDMPPPPPEFTKRKGVITQLPVAGRCHGDILNWKQQPSALEARQNTQNYKRNYQAKDIHTGSGINVTKWASAEESQEALVKEQSNLYGSKTKKDHAQKKSTNILEWDKHIKSEAPPFEKKKKDEYVWYAGHKKKTSFENMHHGRPSPFGVDDEPSAYKIAQGLMDKGGTSPQKKNNIKSLAESLQ